MDERYFYLGILAGALILIIGTAFLNGIIGREDTANQQPEDPDNITANYTIDRPENRSRNTTYGSLQNERQVIINRYIPPQGREVHIYRSNDSNDRDDDSCHRRCRELEDRYRPECRDRYTLDYCERIQDRERHCPDCRRYGDTNINFYFGDSDREKYDLRDRYRYREQDYRHHKYKQKKAEDRRRERDCEWWDTGYRRLARDGWHGSDEFDCWR